VRVLLAFLFLALALATVSAAQLQEIVAMPEFPVPAWPASGVVPPDMKDKYVFVDLSKNEYVLHYPENLGTEAYEKDGPAPPKTARYELHRNVEPGITATVTAVTPQRYKYAYTVTNGSAAKQSIDQWALSMPAPGGEAAIKAPAGWFAIVQKDRAFKVRNPNFIQTGASAVWSFNRPEEFILPGSSKSGFELESELRPGFTTSYFRKSESIEAKIATQGTGVPKVVQDQIDMLLAVEYNSKTLLTMAPKFESGATDQTIALDFIQGIDVLMRAGVLNGNSDFVKNTLTELRGAAKTFTTMPRGPVETEILGALRVSFRLN
jgi:hypothetical protein